MTAVAKRWTRHAALLADGDWHVHSRWSNDAQGTIHDYCRQARENGLKLIAFTEHVRRKLLFDFAAFSADVDGAREEFPDLVILKGCEAKVMNAEGEIDAPDHVLEQCDVVIGSFHSFPNPSDYVTALAKLLCNPQVDIWGHPTLYAMRNGIPLDLATVESLIDLATDRQVLIEFNRKYRLPSDAMRALVVERGAKYVISSDAHRVDALRSRKDES
ncbi:MAG TPA: PHP domain-containing protein [Methylomirabilota bacterium]|jgi:histidinol phosphatase-like PHP family hydrolase|nr:PHP domain-containing protein [Methylomirabilota bacterium]